MTLRTVCFVGMLTVGSGWMGTTWVSAQGIQPKIVGGRGDTVPAAAFLVDRPTLGSRVAAVSDEARREYGLTTRRGALIVEVQANGPLDKVGIAPGVVIMALDGRRVDSPQDLIEMVRESRVGQVVELTYYEGPQLRRTRVRLASSDDPTAVPPPAADEADAAELTPRLPSPAGGPGEERPGLGRASGDRGQPLKRLERVLEGLSRPPGEAALPALDRDADVIAELERLRLEVLDLRRTVVELEQRIAALEPRAKPAGKGDDDRPALAEPALKPPANERPKDAPPPPPKPDGN